MPHEIQFLGFGLVLKYRTLHDMGSRFWEFLRQALECFCRYDCKRGILLGPGYNAMMERGFSSWSPTAGCKRGTSEA